MAIGVGSDGDDVDDVLVAPSDFNVPTPRQLRALRILADMTLKEAAHEMGVSPATVHKWERGEHSPRLEDVDELLSLYASESNQTQFLR